MDKDTEFENNNQNQSSYIEDEEELDYYTKKKKTPRVLSAITMNKYMAKVSKEKIPDKLFGPLWYEGEICILFSDTNLGKSLLAVQIADSISYGKEALNFSEIPKASKVAILDIELHGKLVESRYSEKFTLPYRFSENLIRMDVIPSNISEETDLEDQVLEDIITISESEGIKIFIIDNITALITDFEKSRNAIKLMKKLLELKKDKGLSILVLAHTPKTDPTKVISKNDLSGSKHLMNFVDSAFSIGKSITNDQGRYIKQIKSRFGAIEYGTENVIKCHIEKENSNFLKFFYEDTVPELLFLNTYKDFEKDARAKEIVRLRDEKQMTFEQIGQELGIAKGTANKIYSKAKGK